MLTGKSKWDFEYENQGLTHSQYVSIHIFINKVKTKSGTCNICQRSCNKRTEWALIKGRRYSRNIEDYMELCPSCHKKYDYKESTRVKASLRMKNHFKHHEYRLPKYTRHNHPANRKVVKMDKNTLEELKVYDSITQACLDVSGKITGAIQNNINGLSDTAYGFKWKYYE